MPLSAVLLVEDETDLRLFPEFRRAWFLKGRQARIAITGENKKVVLFATINVLTGHRIVAVHSKMDQQGFQAFLRLLRHRYSGRQIWLLLDGASVHTAPKSQALANALNIKLVWLPKQCSELNCLDHFWRQLKADVSANYQYTTIEEHARFAVHYCLSLTNRQAQRRAGILSENFWLKSFFK
jgi:DDE superfamily endonuclease